MDQMIDWLNSPLVNSLIDWLIKVSMLEEDSSRKSFTNSMKLEGNSIFGKIAWIKTSR